MFHGETGAIRPRGVEAAAAKPQSVPLCARAVRGEVAEILVMFSHIERCIDRLPSTQAALLSGYADRVFRGFDRFREGEHYRAARAIIDRSGFFDEFQSRRLASPAPMLDRYRPLLGRFDLERRQTGVPADFTFERTRRVLLLH